MARRAAHAPLDVYLNGRLVGRMRRESSGAVDFQYDQSWLGWNNAIPVSISLPLREDRYIGEPVLAVFEGLLPDNDAIRRRLAERSKADGSDVYSLLAAIGRDCIGAVQFLPEGIDPGKPGAIDARVVSDAEVASVIGNLAQNPLGVGADQEFRISLAGAQEKTALLYWNNKWHVPHGTTATTHIIKPQIGKLPNGIDLSNSVENEHYCLELVAAFGLSVAKSQILDFAGNRVLAIERFDRIWTRDNRLLRVPQEDCCQALSIPPWRKYEAEGGPGIRDLTELLKGSDAPDEDQKTLFKAQILFWLLGATDGHAKNFSVRLAPGGRFRLTPLYDIVSTQPNVEAGQLSHNQMKMAMTIGKNRHYIVHTIVGRHFLETAQRCGLPDKMARDTIEELKAAGASAFDRTHAALSVDFPMAVADSIAAAAQRRLASLTDNAAKGGD
jgi:serine/threonine-protein kinase HipA